MEMLNPMPWSSGIAVNEMYLILTFKPGSATEGYFVAEAYTASSPSTLVVGRGVFSVLVP
jgi:hypothetical protein